MSLVTQNLSVAYDGSVALESISMSVITGERFAVMGPSGSGKSSLLRAVAGIVPSTGSIVIDGEDVSAVPTHRRPIGLMFQEYALFPHMTVAENVGYGLRMQGVDRSDRSRQVQHLLDLVGLAEFTGRNASSLSGGEQQRVALARTLAPRPLVAMFDEPLGSLDTALKETLLIQMKAIVEQLGTTSIYVTHDREEAFAFADRLAILDAGRVATVGTPQEVWSNPQTVNVARLLGHPNVLEHGIGSGSPILIPLDAVHRDARDAGGGLTATVRTSTFVDGRYRVETQVEGVAEPITFMSSEPVRTGDSIRLSIDLGRVVGLASSR